MTKEEVFIADIKNYIEENKKCNGILVPNQFNLRRQESNKVIGKFGNKSIVITEQLLQDFVIIGKYVLSTLSKHHSYLPYGIISYIGETIKYNSNVVKINVDIIRGYTGIGGLNARTLSSAINLLTNYSIIGETNVRHIYTVNPIAIFKGSVYKFVEIAEQYNLQDCLIEDNKLILDKAVIIKDKSFKEIEPIYNKKYYKKVDDKYTNCIYNFNKKI